MIAFHFKFVSNVRPDQQKSRLRLGFAKVGQTSPCPLQNSVLSVLSTGDQEKIKINQKIKLSGLGS